MSGGTWTSDFCQIQNFRQLKLMMLSSTNNRIFYFHIFDFGFTWLWLLVDKLGIQSSTTHYSVWFMPQLISSFSLLSLLPPPSISFTLFLLSITLSSSTSFSLPISLSLSLSLFLFLLLFILIFLLPLLYLSHLSHVTTVHHSVFNWE